MSKKQVGFCLIVVFGLLHFSATRAAVIGFDPATQTVAQGNTAGVDLVISGLGFDVATGNDPILSAFELHIAFDPSILSFQNFVVNPNPVGLNPSGLDFGLFNGSSTPGPGIVEVFDLSADIDPVLRLFQADSFSLGTILFDTVGPGTSALIITAAILGGETSPEATLPLEAELETGAITVSAVVPVPAAAWFFGTGLVGLIGFARRKNFTRQS